MNRRAYQRALASFPWFIQDLPNPHLGSIKSVNFRWRWLPSPCCSPRLKPFLRLAASLVRHNCHITLITPHPTVLLAESQYLSDFLSAFPQVTEKQFRLLPIDPPSADSLDLFFSCSGDPFATLLTFSFYPLFGISSP